MIKLFDIPIYSMPIEKFNDKWDKYDNKMRNTLFKGKEDMYNNNIEKFPDPIRKWKYNQIIGYIVISYHANTIWFDLHLTIAKKLHFKTHQKYPIRNMGINGCHFTINQNSKNNEIIQKISHYLEKIKEEFLNKDSYIDTESFDNMVKMIDFTALKKIEE